VIYGLVASLCFGAGWKVNGWRLGDGIAQDQVQAVTIVRVVERAQQSVADVEGEKGHAELEEARRAADAARATAAGLRAEAGRIATRLAACNAGTDGERQARQDAAELLAEVLGEMEGAGRGMAETADRARAAGATCERTYDGVKAALE
jgi:hypothetical protein